MLVMLRILRRFPPVERPAGTLDAQIHYAETLAKSNLLPAAYRDRPANVLLAAQLGDALGIPTIQAINSIHVIEGKPSAGADLIASIVRRSGHKLRIVETRDQDGPVLPAASAREPVLATQAYAKQLKDADALIRDVIESNLPPGHKA